MVAALVTTAMLSTFGALTPSIPGAALPSATWSIVVSPNASSTQDNVLFGVSCTSPSACTAVGYYTNSAAYTQTLIEQWNGTAWSVVPSPDTSPTQNDFLYGVSCTSASACTAVGRYLSGTYAQTLIEQWNGTAWSVVPSPNTSITQSNELYGVSCTSTSACMAVGYDFTGTYYQTLIEQWNGTTWSITPSVDTSPTLENFLYGVSCTSPSACTAVGYYTSAGAYSQTLIEKWNGIAWSLVPSPDTSPTQSDLLYGISCTSPSNCTAVGYVHTATYFRTLVEQWNGTAWSLVPSPNTSPTQNDFLYGISCTSSSACTAVGYYFSGSHYQTLIEEWNGAAWSIDSSSDASPVQNDHLYGVSCSSASGCTTVGFHDSGVNATLIETRPFVEGYWLVAADGGVFSFNAPFFGSTGNAVLNKPIVGMAATPDGGGYWFVSSDGGVFSYGDATFYGSMGNLALNVPIVGMAADPATGGYWLVGSDGGIFSFNAPFYGSTGNAVLNKPIVGMAATPDGGGYWFVASDGGVFSFGDAHFYGSMGAVHLNAPVVGMAADQATGGYWLVASDGGIFSFNALFYGSTGNLPLNAPIVGIMATPDGGGYWFVASDGGVFAYGDDAFLGSMGAQHLNRPIVGSGSI